MWAKQGSCKGNIYEQEIQGLYLRGYSMCLHMLVCTCLHLTVCVCVCVIEIVCVCDHDCMSVHRHVSEGSLMQVNKD